MYSVSELFLGHSVISLSWHAVFYVYCDLFYCDFFIFLGIICESSNLLLSSSGEDVQYYYQSGYTFNHFLCLQFFNTYRRYNKYGSQIPFSVRIAMWLLILWEISFSSCLASSYTPHITLLFLPKDGGCLSCTLPLWNLSFM